MIVKHLGFRVFMYFALLMAIGLNVSILLWLLDLVTKGMNDLTVAKAVLYAGVFISVAIVLEEVIWQI